MAQASSAGLARRLTWRIDQVFVGRRDRVAVVAAATLVGILLPTLAGSPPAALAAASGLAILSAGPLGLSKTATACGLNALGSFGLETRLVRSRLVDWALYAATSTASGATLGAIMWWAGSWLHSPALLLLAARILADPTVLPAPNSRRIESYSQRLVPTFASPADAEALFSRAAAIVDAAAAGNFDRDNIRTLPFTEEVVRRSQAVAVQTP